MNGTRRRRVLAVRFNRCPTRRDLMGGGLHRVTPDLPGYLRRRRGRGFEYVDAEGRRIEDETELERIRALAIPPAWTEVWICRDPKGHLQAVGKDVAGRRQYLYHDAWRRRRDRAKYRRMESFAAALPGLRGQVSRDLRRQGLPRERVLACAVRLLDTGPFRIGSEAYASNGSFGLATIRKDHVRVGKRLVSFDFVGKAGIRHTFEVSDPQVIAVLRRLRRRGGGGEELLAYRNGRDDWCDVRSVDVNRYIQHILGSEHSAKDFRTWRATLLATALLSGAEGPNRKKIVAQVVRDVAAHMGNTPAVCRSAYIDPRVLDRYLDAGESVDLGDVDLDADSFSDAVEAEVLTFLKGETPEAA
jgi:DNA topoisomerase I